MAKHANIPHEIVWSLRRSMESALRMMDELEEVLKDLGPNPDPTNLESKVEEQLAQLANVRPELEILTNIFEELVHQYVDNYVMRKKELDYDKLLDEIARHKRDLQDVIARLADFKEGKLSE